VPPVATIKGDVLIFSVESLTVTQPSVESTKTKVTDCPSVVKITATFSPPILSEPLGEIVQLLVPKVDA
jgi:hypothetical protein